MLLIASGVLIFVSLLYPMWQIQLEAPQYPEGLVLKLHAHKIGGDWEIINGLNHYIGMKTLHTENFVEFSFLPYVIAGFGLLALIFAIFPNRKRVVTLFTLFLIFAVLAAVDFYRWNYEYGHDLDPNAAIQVPGMAYQPPLLGYKQLLNFAAYSIPDTGGWMLITAGVLLFIAVLIETKFLNRFKKKSVAVAPLLLLFMMSCAPERPKPIKLNTDNCESCKMTISNGKFAAQVLTKKGRHYKFDDVACMIRFMNENHQHEYAGCYVGDYLQDNTQIPAETAFYLQGGKINSPMRGNVAAFSNKEQADQYWDQLEADAATWEEVQNLLK